MRKFSIYFSPDFVRFFQFRVFVLAVAVLDRRAHVAPSAAPGKPPGGREGKMRAPGDRAAIPTATCTNQCPARRCCARWLPWAVCVLCVFALPALVQSRQPPGDSPLELIVLASGGPRASARGSTSYIVLLDGTPRILIDAGANAFVEVGKLNLSLDQMDIVLLTHLHIDHTSDLPAIFNERALGARNAIKWRIFGPDGAGQFPSTSKFIHTLFDAGGIYEYQRTFGQDETVNVTDLAITLASPQKEIVRDGTGERSLTIEEIATHHDDCPSIAYRIHYKSLSITFAGDMDASALPNLEHLAKETDLLVVHAAVLDPPGSPAILYTLHTAPAKLGEVARAAGVKRLLLSHIPGSVEAREPEVTRSIRRSYKGPIEFASTGLRLPLPR